MRLIDIEPYEKRSPYAKVIYEPESDFGFIYTSHIPTYNYPIRAKWIDFHITNDGVAEELCGKCEEWTIGRHKRYCPCCGARMNEEV